MKKTVLFLIFYTGMLLCQNVHANKSYVFTYDSTGNRITVSFTSTCGERLKDSTKTTKEDTIIEKALKEIEQVTIPKAYPNLVRDYFILSLPNLETVATIKIYDINGMPVYQDESITTSQNIIKTCDLASGTYTIVVNYNNAKPFVQKIIKQ
jgi:hypothetical protein